MTAGTVATRALPSTIAPTLLKLATEQRTRRWLQICGFFSGGDGGVTYWRKRTFRRGENIALDNARHCVGKIVADAEKLAAAERAAERRNDRKPIAA